MKFFTYLIYCFLPNLLRKLDFCAHENASVMEFLMIVAITRITKITLVALDLTPVNATMLVLSKISEKNKLEFSKPFRESNASCRNKTLDAQSSGDLNSGQEPKKYLYLRQN